MKFIGLDLFTDLLLESLQFYFIVVLMQLAVITPWLVKSVKQNGIISRILWLVMPVYLVYLYTWNYIVGISPRIYETLFPA